MTIVSSERVQFQMVKVGADWEPPSDGAHHLTIAEAEGGFLCAEKGFHLEELVFIAG